MQWVFVLHKGKCRQSKCCEWLSANEFRLFDVPGFWKARTVTVVSGVPRIYLTSVCWNPQGWTPNGGARLLDRFFGPQSCVLHGAVMKMSCTLAAP